MKKLIADGKIKRVERKLLKHIKKEYESADGKLWAEIDSITVDRGDGIMLTFSVRYGREGGEYAFTHELTLAIADGSADFIVGQIAGAIQIIDERLGWQTETRKTSCFSYVNMI